MNDQQQLQSLLGKLQEVYESGKPLAQDIAARWQQHHGLLSMTRFLISVSPAKSAGESNDLLRQEMLTQFDQLTLDFQQLLAILMSYQGLTLAITAMAKDYRETNEQK